MNELILKLREASAAARVQANSEPTDLERLRLISLADVLRAEANALTRRVAA